MLGDWAAQYTKLMQYLDNLQGSLVYEAGLADPVIFTRDMWSPQCYISPGFRGTLFSFTGSSTSSRPRSDSFVWIGREASHLAPETQGVLVGVHVSQTA